MHLRPIALCYHCRHTLPHVREDKLAATPAESAWLSGIQKGGDDQTSHGWSAPIDTVESTLMSSDHASRPAIVSHNTAIQARSKQEVSGE